MLVLALEENDVWHMSYQDGGSWCLHVSFIERLKELSNQLTLGGFGAIDLIADGTVVAIDVACHLF